MTKVVRDIQGMLAGMTPVLKDGDFIFCSTNAPFVIAAAQKSALSSFREDEGMAFILDIEAAKNLGFDTGMPMKRIVLEVFSALDGVGLTAAVASVLADNDIPCNMLAAYHHDNVFVPSAKADRALSILMAVQRQAAV